jgi:hypothetical protein
VPAALLVAEDPAPISWASPVCAVQLNLLAALARPDAKVRDHESEATRHIGARPDRDAATIRYFLHWPCRTLAETSRHPPDSLHRVPSLANWKCSRSSPSPLSLDGKLPAQSQVVLPILQPQLRPLRVRQELTMRYFLHWSLRIVAPARFSKSELLGS